MQASGTRVLDAGDVDGDGRVDLVVANTGQNRAAILAGDGAGGFAPARLVGTGARPRALQFADMDGDGGLNIVTASDGTIRNLWVLTNRGGGDFAGIAHVSIGGEARSLRIADGFAPARLVGTGARPRALQFADMDGDGGLNIVTASDGTIRNLWVLTNRGGGRRPGGYRRLRPHPRPGHRGAGPRALGRGADRGRLRPGQRGLDRDRRYHRRTHPARTTDGSVYFWSRSGQARCRPDFRLSSSRARGRSIALGFRVVVDAGEHVGEPGAGIDVVEPSRSRSGCTGRRHAEPNPCSGSGAGSGRGTEACTSTHSPLPSQTVSRAPLAPSCRAAGPTTRATASCRHEPLHRDTRTQRAEASSGSPGKRLRQAPDDSKEGMELVQYGGSERNDIVRTTSMIGGSPS